MHNPTNWMDINTKWNRRRQTQHETWWANRTSRSSFPKSIPTAGHNQLNSVRLYTIISVIMQCSCIDLCITIWFELHITGLNIQCNDLNESSGQIIYYSNNPILDAHTHEDSVWWLELTARCCAGRIFAWTMDNHVLANTNIRTHYCNQLHVCWRVCVRAQIPKHQTYILCERNITGDSSFIRVTKPIILLYGDMSVPKIMCALLRKCARVCWACPRIVRGRVSTYARIYLLCVDAQTRNNTIKLKLLLVAVQHDPPGRV